MVRHLTVGLVLATLSLVAACEGDDGPGPGTAGSAGTTVGGAGGGGSGGGGSGGVGGNVGGSGGGTGGAEPNGALTVTGDQFSIDGTPTFLLGVSYFDGRNWRSDDLDELAARQFNLIRIWLDWSDQGFFDGAGQLVEQATLLDLVQACRSRGIMVDVTILDTDLTLSDPVLAVTETVSALAAEPNVLFDLVNEHDHSGDTFSHDDLAPLVSAARTADPGAILTVSSQGSHIMSDLTLHPANIDAEIVTLGLDLLTPHLTRTADFYDKTDQRVTLIKDYLSSIGYPVPVYLQEEARRGHSGLDPTEAQFIQAATEARDAGAAGWVFHTDAGFDLATASFFDNLDGVEASTVDHLGDAIFGG